MDGDLATELRLSICQYLSGEKATLQNLSLVSRNWLAPAQACMFEKIGACVLFPSKDDNTHSPAGLSRFFRSSPHLATYVREVQIVGAYSLITCGFGALYPLLNVEDIFEVVSVIPNLHILTIRTCEVNAGPSKGLIDPTKRCLSVRDLSLLRIGVNDFSLWLLLDRFNVVNLYVDGTTIYGSKDTIKLSPSYSVATRTLDLSAVEYYQSHPTPLSADVILSVPDSLKNFGISCNLKEAKEVETICVFLETSVPNLEHLCLDYTGVATEKIARRWRKSVKIPKEAPLRGKCRDGFGCMYPECTRIPRLAKSCPSLKTLTFTLSVAEETEDTTTDAFVRWGYALRVLASAPRSLTSLTVGLELYGDGINMRSHNTLNFVDWEKWDAVLREFAELEHVEFVLLDRSLTTLNCPASRRITRRWNLLGPEEPPRKGLRRVNEMESVDQFLKTLLSKLALVRRPLARGSCRD